MEAAIRSSVQVAGPPPSGQRGNGNDNGPSPQQQNQQTGGASSQQPPNMSGYQQRIPSGASPIHRPVDTPQSYSKGGIGPPPPSTSRSAASPLSPPRPGPGAGNPYPRFADVTAREAPHRYVQQSPYSIGPVAQYRENPYARIPQLSQQVQDYHRAAAAAAAASVVVSSNNSLPGGSAGPTNTIETVQLSHAAMGGGGHVVSAGGRQRISLLAPPPQSTAQHPSEYIGNSSSSRQPTQAPPDPGGQPYKKLRIGETNHMPPQIPSLSAGPHHPTSQPQPQIHATSAAHPAPTASQPPVVNIPPTQQLKVDTRESRPANTEAYHPQVEAISPTLPNETGERRTAKDDLIMQINKVDMEIGNAEKSKKILQGKVKTLEEASTKPAAAKEEAPVQPKRHQSLAQKIYEENRKKAAARHSTLSSLGSLIELPLYNQPCDSESCEEVIKRHQTTIKSRLLTHLKKIKLERAQRNAGLVEKYAQLSQDWLKRVEKAEASAKRKAKEAKNREFFEKVFTELRKQREEKERFNRVGSRVKSEADLEEIMDGLQEQALEDKKMRSYAVIPPLMLDNRQRRYVFYNENGALADMSSDYKDRQNLNVWTAGEKEIFKEKYLQHPKNFGAIAASLDRKSVQDCVRYYYLSKKTENYKQLLRKSRQRTRSSRNPQKSQQPQTQCIVDSLTTGVTTRLQREQQQKTGGRDRTAQITANSTGTTTASTSSMTVTTATSILSGTVTNVSGSISTTIVSSSASDTLITSTESGFSTKPIVRVPTPTTSSTSSNPSATVPLLSTTAGTTKLTTSTTSDRKSPPVSTTTTLTATNSSNALESSFPSKNGTEPASTSSVNKSTSYASNSTINKSNEKSLLNVTTSSSSSSSVQPVKNLEETVKEEKECASPKNGGVQIISSGSVSSNSTNVTTFAKVSVSNCTNTNSANSSSTTASTTATIAAAAKLEGRGGNTDSMIKNDSDIANSHPLYAPNGIKTELVVAASAGLNETKSNDKDFLKNESSLLSGDNNNRTTGVQIRGVEGGGLKTKSASEIDGSDNNSDVSDAKRKRLDSDIPPDPAILVNDTSAKALDSNNSAENKDKLNPCFVCKAEGCPRTRPLKKGRGQQYGISDETISAGARVCNSCQCKSVRSRYPNCPLPTCPNPKDRAKRLHNIPPRLYELPSDMRDAITHEFQIPTNANRCCSACLMRIRRRIDPHTNLAEEDRRTDGDESDLSTSSCDERDGGSDTASVDSPNNPVRLNSIKKDDNQSANGSNSTGSKSMDDRLLPPLGQAPKKQKTSEEYDSSATETADEENENSPANRQSPKVILNPNQGVASSGSGPTTSSLSMIPPPNSNVVQNGPQRSGEQSMNVRDFVYNFIERSLKTTGPPPKTVAVPLINQQPQPQTPQQQAAIINSDSRSDVTFVREFRSEGLMHKQPATTASPTVTMQPQPLQSRSSQPSSSQTADNLATLSVVNSHSHQFPPQMMSNPHGIAATITPVKSVPLGPRPQSQHQSSGSLIGHDIHSSEKDEMMYSARNEPEPQTLDLSIKKPSRESGQPSQPMHVPSVSSKHSSNSTSMYRSEPPAQSHQPPQSQPAQNQTYLFHPADINRPTKSPAVYVAQVPVPIPISQPTPQSSMRAQQQQQLPPSSQPGMTGHSQMQSKGKMAPKLSPKVHQQPPSPSQMMGGGPKGSITHGTPISSQQQQQQQQQILVQGSSNLSPKFDGILRQTPPSGVENNKLGSITQGTPVHLPAHHIQEKQRVFEYYKNNRQSPAQPLSTSQQSQPPQQSSPQAQNFVSSPYGRPAYALEQTPQLSSRQIVMNDYIISQQMHGQQRNVSRNEKESPSPRNSALGGSPALIYYSDKERSRAEYLSRASPAEHANSTPSPHRTPPPQRQGVIQRHNTGGSKPPSPAPSRLHVIPHNYPPAGHEAFSSFVDVAVQQPQLPVPQKEEKRSLQDNPPPPPQSHHHEIRYHQSMRDHVAMQIQQQHQQQHFRQQAQAAAMADLHRRQQEQYTRERIHAQQERDRQERERERERLERHNQERLQAERDRMERERERERRERERVEEQEREDRRREAVRYIASTNPGAPPYLRTDPPPRGIPDRERDPYNRQQHPSRPTEGTFTASSLIDAIIKHSINQGASDPPLANLSRDNSRQPFYTARDIPPPPHAVTSTIAASENNGKSSSPNVINIDLDGDRGPPPVQPNVLPVPQFAAKSITIGELADSIITKDYGPTPPHLRPYLPFMPDPIITTDQWKYRRMQQKEAEAAEQRNKNAVGRSNTPDERQIIRMAQQPPSPRNKFHHELVLPPDSHYYQQAQQAAAAAAAAGAHPGADRRGGPTHQFALDCYVKNRIVEAMRTEDERRPEESHMHGHHDPHHHRPPSSAHNKEQDVAQMAKMNSRYEDGRRSGSSSSSGRPANNDSHMPSSSYQPVQPPPVTTFATTTYAYPYSALNVQGPPPSVLSHQSGKNIESHPPTQQQSIAAEPKPLLSAQYEELSDED